MAKWQNGIRGASLMVLLWVVGWGLGFGGLAELLIDPDGETLDIWPAEMAIPGLVGAVVFALLLRVSEGNRHFDEVPLARFTGWGVLTGLVLAALSITTEGPIPLSLTALEMIGLATGLGAVAAFGSAVFFRLLAASPAVAARTR
ncbi:MAG: hypothetical protein AB7P33_10540 [Dehalococcoidia bacterium]